MLKCLYNGGLCHHERISYEERNDDFTKDKLLTLLEDIEPEEMVRLMLNTFDLEEIMMLMPEEELQNFFTNKEVRKEDVAKFMKALPPELMQQLMESLTGQPSFQVDRQRLHQRRPNGWNPRCLR